jgi:hypothetical protein
MDDSIGAFSLASRGNRRGEPDVEGQNSARVFGPDIDIKDLCTPEVLASGTKYELFAVVVQKGEQQGGHYWPFIKDEVGQWRKFNDASVRDVDFEAVQRSGQGLEEPYGSAYMLIYKKVGSDALLAGEADFQIPTQLRGAEAPMLQKWGVNPDAPKKGGK